MTAHEIFDRPQTPARCDVAHRLSVPVSWVYARAEAGELPSFKVGRYRRFSGQEIDRYIEAQRQGRWGAGPALAASEFLDRG